MVLSLLVLGGNPCAGMEVRCWVVEKGRGGLAWLAAHDAVGQPLEPPLGAPTMGRASSAHAVPPYHVATVGCICRAV